MLWQHLEANEVGVLVADHRAVHKDVVLLMHQLSERVDVQGSAHADEQLRVFHVAVELAEGLRLRAVGQVQVVELLQVIVVGVLSTFLYCPRIDGKNYSRGGEGPPLALYLQS